MPERWHFRQVKPAYQDFPFFSLNYEVQKNMIRLLFVVAVLGLAGCATASNTYLKNGKQGLSIDCSGEAMSWASCYEKADASCAGTGYEIVGTDGTPQPKESDKTLGVDVGNFKSRSVLVVCK
jgi:hypothetical protein